jgi:hypothetical protein
VRDDDDDEHAVEAFDTSDGADNSIYETEEANYDSSGVLVIAAEQQIQSFLLVSK